MNAFQSGAAIGFACAAIVAVLGLLFIRSTTTTFIDIGSAIRSFARHVLGWVSLALIVVGLCVAIASGGYAFYCGALVSYVVGLMAYFGLRYGVFKFN